METAVVLTSFRVAQVATAQRFGQFLQFGDASIIQIAGSQSGGLGLENRAGGSEVEGADIRQPAGRLRRARLHMHARTDADRSPARGIVVPQASVPTASSTGWPRWA